MLKIYQRYAPDAVAPTTAYPLGSIKNDSVPGADDGTPLEKDWGNNVEGFHQALMADAALTASGSPDTAVASQLLEAVKIVAASVVKTQMASVFYPVGTYYGNDTDPTNPAILFGFGTWVRVEGRALMGCDGTGAGTFGTPGSQGGALTHTHTADGTAITIAQMPSHGHTIAMGTSYINDADGGDGRILTSNREIAATVSPATYIRANTNGSGQTHTHTIQSASSLPPYRVAYLWRRTA